MFRTWTSRILKLGFPTCYDPNSLFCRLGNQSPGKLSGLKSAFGQLAKLLLIHSISGKIELCKRRSTFLLVSFIKYG